MIVFTNNNWETTAQVIGEHQYKVYNPDTKNIEIHTGYGVTAEFLASEYITGKTIVGGTIFSSNYGQKTENGIKVKLISYLILLIMMVMV